MRLFQESAHSTKSSSGVNTEKSEVREGGTRELESHPEEEGEEEEGSGTQPRKVEKVCVKKV